MKKINIKLDKKSKIAIIILVILLIMFITFNPRGIINTIKNQLQNEEVYSLSYEIKKYNATNDEYNIVMIIAHPDGIETIECVENDESNENNEIIECYGKKRIGIDYAAKDFEEFEYIIKFSNGETKREKIQFEKPRIGKDLYRNVKDVYVDIPNLDGYNEDFTRYLKISEEGYLQPDNWITDEEPENWYDYKNQQWANIYVENKGLESYYVWIPRYAYKISENNTSGNERVDIKFVDVYNNYIDAETEQKTLWSELKAQGYKIPEAFEVGEDFKTSIPGYWMSKYELSELEKYAINYNLTASMTNFKVDNFSVDEEKQQRITKYTYAINGEIVYETNELENYLFNNTNSNSYNIINITALDECGRIVGSMTKKLELVDVNEPDLEGFDKETTFYVYWDENGIEHNEIPISQQAPDNWYNYSYSAWANIVTRNNGLESYFIWIPRYQYMLDTTSERVEIKFIVGTSNTTEPGYKIPEAFTFDGKELSGYWISKYELSTDQVNARLNAEISASDNTIVVSSLSGTAVTEDTRYEYYLNANKQYEGMEATYKYTSLSKDTTYTVTIIARNKDTNEFLGAVTNKIITEPVNEPKFDGFVENKTYYVLYDDSGNEIIGNNIKLDGSNIPNNWYDYSDKKWANIVVTDGRIENGKIVDETTKSYFVWIPRYQYILDTVNQRAKIKFMRGISTDTQKGYKIPEAFTFDGKELYGYWISKYELSTTGSILQSDGNTPTTKNRDTWMVDIRKMESSGGTLGLSEVQKSDLTANESNNIDIHMQKNTEYGAVALLSASSYGKTDKIGNGETTTGNQSGVVIPYRSEWVAAQWTQDTNIIPMPSYNSKYINYYNNATNQLNGDAFIETSGWHSSGTHGNTTQRDTIYWDHWDNVYKSRNRTSDNIPGYFVRNTNNGIFSWNNCYAHMAYYNGTYYYYAFSLDVQKTNSYASRAVIVNGVGL